MAENTAVCQSFEIVIHLSVLTIPLIAKSPDRLYVLGRRRVFLYLHAQTSDIYVYDLVLAYVGIAPDVL